MLLNGILFWSTRIYDMNLEGHVFPAYCLTRPNLLHPHKTESQIPTPTQDPIHPIHLCHQNQDQRWLRIRLGNQIQDRIVNPASETYPIHPTAEGSYVTGNNNDNDNGNDLTIIKNLFLGFCSYYSVPPRRGPVGTRNIA